MNNSVRHGKARRISIRLGAAAAGGVSLSVTDDGIGLPPAPNGAGGTGLGLRLMSNRAKMIRGSLDVRPGPAGGTVVECSVGGAAGAGGAA